MSDIVYIGDIFINGGTSSISAPGGVMIPPGESAKWNGSVWELLKTPWSAVDGLNKRIHSDNPPSTSGLTVGDYWVNTGPNQTFTAGGKTYDIDTNGEAVWDGTQFKILTSVSYDKITDPTSADGNNGDVWVNKIKGFVYKKSSDVWDLKGTINKKFTGASGTTLPSSVAAEKFFLLASGTISSKSYSLYKSASGGWVNINAQATMSDEFFSETTNTLFYKTLDNWEARAKTNAVFNTDGEGNEPLVYPSNSSAGDIVIHTNTAPGAENGRKTVFISYESALEQIRWKAASNLVTHSSHLTDVADILNTKIIIDSGVLKGIGSAGVTVDNAVQKWSQVVNDNGKKAVDGATKNTGLFANIEGQLTPDMNITNYIAPETLGTVKMATFSSIFPLTPASLTQTLGSTFATGELVLPVRTGYSVKYALIFSGDVRAWSFSSGDYADCVFAIYKGTVKDGTAVKLLDSAVTVGSPPKYANFSVSYSLTVAAGEAVKIFVSAGVLSKSANASAYVSSNDVRVVAIMQVA
jgi:hypothetical protein